MGCGAVTRWIRAAGAISALWIFLLLLAITLVTLEPPEADKILAVVTDIVLLLSGIVIGRELR